MAKTDNLIRTSDFAVFVKGMRGDWVAHPDTGRIYSNCIGNYLKPFMRKNGYPALTVEYRQGGREYHGEISLHRAMWILCRGIPTSLNAEVDHIDHNRQNNRLENLRLVYKDENRSRKITFEDAEEIRRRYAEGESQKTLGKEYGLSRSSVGEIVRRETYRNPPQEMHTRRL